MNGLAVMLMGMAAIAMLSMTAVRADEAPAQPKQEGCDDSACDDKATPSALNFTMKSIAGEEVPLTKYQGKAVLIVNVASKCGHTKQYADLQALHEKFGDKGLAVLGFPCNQFGGQEPGTPQEIQTFCSTRYNVTFDLFDKIDVKGDDAAPLFAYLTGNDVPIEDKGPVKWNFEKFLLDRESNVIARFRSKVSPSSEDVIAAIEKALAPSEDAKAVAATE